MSRCLQIAFVLFAGVFLFAAPLFAQLQIGNNLNLNANGTLATSYTGSYGNLTGSDHSIGVGGTGSISGYYFNPNFISFSATPYYNTGRDSSAYRSISNTSGFDSTAMIFGGSSFPGSVSYSKAYDSQGTFNVPGIASLTTHGNSDSFGVSWGEHLHGRPSLTASYQKSSSQNTIYGLSQSSHSSSHSFNLNSSYQWLGFNLGGSYYMGGSNSAFPEFLAGSTALPTSRSTDHGYSFNVSHRLPWNGSSFASYNSSSVHSTFLTTDTKFTVDTLVTGESFHPSSKLSLSTSMGYSSNLSGSLQQQVIAAGGQPIPANEIASSAHSYDFVGTASYLPMRHMQVQGTAERRIQAYVGKTFGSNTYTAQTSYYHPVLGGNFSASLAMEDGTVDGSPVNTLGFTTTTVYSRKMGLWLINGSFNYSQDVRSLLITYMNSSYGFGGSVQRKFHSGIIWTGSYGGTRTGLAGLSGTTSTGNSLGTGLGLWHWASIGANYAKSSGNGILTGTGLVTSPIATPILSPQAITLFGGRSYAFSVGSSPMHRLMLSASYARSDSTTGSFAGVTGSTNTTKSFNSLVQYQFRKMYLTGGFSRLTQGFSGSGLPPQTISAYYISISRWFNFF